MPPPTSGDAWLASRRFGIVIDAGSSGSRLQLYSWIDPNAVKAQGGQLDRLPQVVKGTNNPDEWISKTEPGISSFAHDLEGIGPYLAPLLNHAREHIPPQLHKDTPIYLLSTAGMRLLPQEEQSAVLTATCDFLRFHSDFKVTASKTGGPCGNQVRVISGEEEGLFGWIAVNYLMESFASNPQTNTFGFLDMGGASTQIAFEALQETPLSSRESLFRVRLRLMNGNEVNHNVFVTTWLGYGTNQARERFVEQLVKSPENVENDTVPDPCLPSGLERKEYLFHGDDNSESFSFLGTGSFENCLASTHALLNKTVACLDPPCLFNGVHVPQVDFNVSKFIGVSEYWYSSEHVFGLGGAYDFRHYEEAASNFCASNWDELVGRYRRPSFDTDGEESSKREYKIELSRLEMQCFKSAWIVNILHEGIGLPRDAKLKDSTLGSKNGVIKGNDAPTFQSVDMIEDTAVSWSLGTMILEASNEVPSKIPSQPELPHPMANSDPVMDERRPSQNDIDEFSRQPFVSLSPLFMLFLVGTSILFYLMRRTIRPILFYCFRRRRKRTDLSFEEGLITRRSTVLPRNAWLRTGTGTFEADNADGLTTSVTQKLGSSLDTQMAIGLLRSKPPFIGSSEAPNGDSAPTLLSSPHLSSGQISNLVTSAHLIPEPDNQTIRSAHPLYALSLSRNSSQINLTTRTSASRISSGSLTPNGIPFVED